MRNTRTYLLILAAVSAVSGYGCKSTIDDVLQPSDCSFGDPRRGPFWTAPFGEQLTIRWDSEVASPCNRVTVKSAAGTASVKVEMVESEIQPFIFGGKSEDPTLEDPSGTIYTYSVKVGVGATTTIAFASSVWEQPTPQNNALDGLRAVLIGDSTGAGVGLKPLIDGMTAFKPGVFVHLGDFQYAIAVTDTWTGLFKMMSPVWDRAVLLPTIGNHETEESPTEASDYYDRLFSVTDGGADGWPRYYRTTVGEVEWIALNSEVDANGVRQQLQWLSGVLAAPDPKAKLRVVYLHQPIWTLAKHAPWQQGSLHPMLTAAGIKIVFSGHNHIYERFVVDGTTYIVSGGAGAELYNQDTDKVQDPAYAKAVANRMKFETDYHYMTMTGKGDAVDFSAMRGDGTPIDTFSIPLQ